HAGHDIRRRLLPEADVVPGMQASHDLFAEAGDTWGEAMTLVMLGRIALLTGGLDDARARGVARISLETGSQPFFAAARALYAKHGFAECPPFGGYRADPNSTFMTLGLQPAR
ncbi:hypothetical protein V2H43_11070, partial [Pasteurella multocida]|nr:hypothetical protein [Pasteurella multocida]